MQEVILPKTGMYEGDVTLLEWLVADGDRVEVGQPIFLMESEKVEQEIEADAAGWLRHQAAEGLEAPIGTRIGVIVDAEADLPTAGG